MFSVKVIACPTIRWLKDRRGSVLSCTYSPLSFMVKAALNPVGWCVVWCGVVVWVRVKKTCVYVVRGVGREGVEGRREGRNSKRT